ncbi:MAG: DUF2332 domain-containing protein [Chloroflexaceae bacterium]|jgi:hypothetical protein|nr:DUF2332 domain-containing protein [Chloroflexaceae bacterium]
MTAELLDDLAQRFAFHATIYGGATPENASPLYAHLSQYVATDTDILQLVLDADRATQVSNLLFGAVHYLLLRGEDHQLRTFYASLTAHPQAPEHAAPVFRDFCGQHAQEIQHLVTTRKVQTNEVQRCTCLLPAFVLTHKYAQEMPLSLIEIGSSAGLHLLWDKYKYNYETIGQIGDDTSEVRLRCSLIGQHKPHIPLVMPLIYSRIGIDINPINVEDIEATRWVRALIWPEHIDRAQLFERAITIARRNPPKIIAGNAAVMLQAAVDNTPKDMALCIFHSYTLNQCPDEIRNQIILSIEEIARSQDVFRISLEWYGGQKQPQLELYSYTKNGLQHELLAYCESHGRSIEWLHS